MKSKINWLKVVGVVSAVTSVVLIGLDNTVFDKLESFVFAAAVLTTVVFGAIAVLQCRANQTPILASLMFILGLVATGIWGLLLIIPA